METEKFQEIKAEILSRAKEADACKEEYSRAYKSETLAKLMQVVKENFRWACHKKVITPGLVEKYREEFAENDIWLNVDVKSGFLLCDNSSVEAWDNSSVVAGGNSSVVARNNSSVVAWDNSSVEAWDNSSVDAGDISSVVARDNSSVVARNNSSVEAGGNSSVEAWDNATVRAYEDATVVAHEEAYVSSDDKIDCELHGNAIYRVDSENTIYYASDKLKFVKQ